MGGDRLCLHRSNWSRSHFTPLCSAGYDMDSVDEFLVALIEDYNTLYKDNATLKSKMRVLVEKLEEYRAEEGGAKENLRAAQQTCDAMIREAEAKCLRRCSTRRRLRPRIPAWLRPKQLPGRDRSPGDAAEGDLGKAGRPSSPRQRQIPPGRMCPRPRARSRWPRRLPKIWKSWLVPQRTRPPCAPSPGGQQHHQPLYQSPVWQELRSYQAVNFIEHAQMRTGVFAIPAFRELPAGARQQAAAGRIPWSSPRKWTVGGEPGSWPISHDTRAGTSRQEEWYRRG